MRFKWFLRVLSQLTRRLRSFHILIACVINSWNSILLRIEFAVYTIWYASRCARPRRVKRLQRNHIMYGKYIYILFSWINRPASISLPRRPGASTAAHPLLPPPPPPPPRTRTFIIRPGRRRRWCVFNKVSGRDEIST